MHLDFKYVKQMGHFKFRYLSAKNIDSKQEPIF